MAAQQLQVKDVSVIYPGRTATEQVVASMAEIEDFVTLRDVMTVVQRMEMVRRISLEIERATSGAREGSLLAAIDRTVTAPHADRVALDAAIANLEERARAAVRRIAASAIASRCRSSGSAL